MFVFYHKISVFYAFRGNFIALLLIFHYILEPNRSFTMKLNSDIHDGSVSHNQSWTFEIQLYLKAKKGTVSLSGVAALICHFLSTQMLGPLYVLKTISCTMEFRMTMCKEHSTDYSCLVLVYMDRQSNGKVLLPY